MTLLGRSERVQGPAGGRGPCAEIDRTSRASAAARGGFGAEVGPGVAEKDLPLLRSGSVGHEPEAFCLMPAEKSQLYGHPDGEAAGGVPVRSLRPAGRGPLEAGGSRDA